MNDFTKIDKPTLELIIAEVSRFSARVIFEGKADTVEDKITNSYADGVCKGYNNAVKQITDFLKDLRNSP